MALHKIIKIVALLLSIAGIVFLAMIVSSGDEAVRQDSTGLDGILYVAYIIFALVLLFVLFYVIKGIFAGNLKRTLLSVGAFILIFVISYVLAEGNEMPLREGGMLSSSDSKWVGTGLYAFYFMAVLAIGAMIFSGFKKITK